MRRHEEVSRQQRKQPLKISSLAPNGHRVFFFYLPDVTLGVGGRLRILLRCLLVVVETLDKKRRRYITVINDVTNSPLDL